MSGTAPYYAEAFYPMPGRCFRLISGGEGGGPTHCPEPPVWRGSWRAPDGRRYWVEACEGHRPHRSTAAAGHLASRQVIPAGAKVQVYPAALPLHLIDLALAVVVAAGLEREQLGVARKRLECCQHVPYSHALSVATWAL